MPSINRSVVLAKAHVDMLCDRERPLADSLAALKLVADYATALIASFPAEYNAARDARVAKAEAVKAAANTAVAPPALSTNTVTSTSTQA